MSDPRLTAAQELDKTIKAVREEGERSQRTHGIGRGFGEYVAQTIEALRADVERLTAENAVLREERDRETELRRGAEAHVRSLQEALDHKPYANEYDDLVAERDALKASGNELFVRAGKLEAENAALREERDAMQALWVGVGRHIDEARIGYNHPQILAVFTENRAVKAERFGLIVRAEQAERELAEAEAEIRRLRNNPIARATGEYLGPMEDWRGANEDGRKEKG